MYPRNITQFIFPLNPNLKNVLTTGYHKQYITKYSFLFRQKINDLKNFEQLHKSFKDIVSNANLFKCLEKPFSSRNPKETIVRVWVQQCECVFAQRLRRCQQMFSLYSTWWEEKALKEFIKTVRQNITRRGKEFAFASVAVYNWDKNRISIEELKSHEKDFEYINQLKDNTICLACDPSTRTNNNTSICKCGTTGKPTDKTFDNWSVFIERQDLVIWRRLHSSGSGQYEYKVFGSYSDVTAEDFLNVQIDVDYRRKWDTTAVVLKQGEKDPQEGTNSDILYWEMQWPRLFVNRDYVFNRRFTVDKQKKTIYMISKSTAHPDFPPYPDKFRIGDYISSMVIKPYTEMNKVGLEFVLTYYDNPGVSIPSSVTTWVAMRAMPDFLEKLRDATKKYKQYCSAEGACKIFKTGRNALEDENDKVTLDYVSFLREAKNIFIQHATGEFNDSESDSGNSLKTKDNKDIANSSDNNGVQQNTNKSSSFLKYFHPLYYFH